MTKIFKPEKISLKEHPEITEKIIQGKIADDPSILGLGDLILKDKERIQPRAGRLDLLFQDPEINRRYEVEIQLGKADESHIIRTIEYWDIEKKRYPQYDHCAVIIAEDITSRFLNVISLFNGFIPLVAIQMNAYKFGDDIGLVFTKIIDELPLGLVDEDEEKEIEQTTTNRDFWNKKSSVETMQLTDKYLAIVNETGKNCELSYTKANIRLGAKGQHLPFVLLKPRKKFFTLVLKVTKSEDIDSIIETGDFDDLGYYRSRYRLRISKEDLADKKEKLKELFLLAEKKYMD